MVQSFEEREALVKEILDREFCLNSKSKHGRRLIEMGRQQKAIQLNSLSIDELRELHARKPVSPDF